MFTNNKECVVCKRIEGTCVKGLKSCTKLEYDGLHTCCNQTTNVSFKYIVALNSTVTSLAKEYLSQVAEAAMKPFGVFSGVNSYQTNEKH